MFFLLCVFSCSFRCRRLDHINGIDWRTDPLFASFRTQIGETDRQSVFIRVCVFSAHLVSNFYYLSFFQVTAYMSSNSRAKDRRAGQPSKDACLCSRTRTPWIPTNTRPREQMLSQLLKIRHRLALLVLFCIYSFF